MLKTNDELNIFWDYQNEKKLIGKVKLISYVRDGLSFILNDDMTKESQITYGTQYWLCEFLEDCYYRKGYRKSFPIKYILNIGHVPTTNDNEDSEYEEQNYKIIDKFIEFDGEEIF